MLTAANKSSWNIFSLMMQMGNELCFSLTFPLLFYKTEITGGWKELKVITSLQKMQFGKLVINCIVIFASSLLILGRTNFSAVFPCDFQKSFSSSLALLLTDLRRPRLPGQFDRVPWSRMLEVCFEMDKQFVQGCVSAIRVVALCPDCLEAHSTGFQGCQSSSFHQN